MNIKIIVSFIADSKLLYPQQKLVTFILSKWIRKVVILIVLTMPITNATFVNGAENKLSERKIYIYSNRELSGFFKDIGYPDFWDNSTIRISRNSDGTALRFLNDRKNNIIVATCDGSVKVIDSPGYLAWLNDANQVIVWVTWTNDRSVAHYVTGMSEKMPFSPEHGPDPSGKYFIKERLGSSATPLNESCYTSIYATKRPDIQLAMVNICGVTKIFYKDNEVYLTGNQYRDGEWQEEEIRVFREEGNTLEQTERIIVPKPGKSLLHFYAEDLSPWNDEMLFIDFHDFPSRSIWYSFNLKTHKLNKVGKVPWFGGRAFYLKCDIVKNVFEKSKSKR